MVLNRAGHIVSVAATKRVVQNGERNMTFTNAIMQGAGVGVFVVVVEATANIITSYILPNSQTIEEWLDSNVLAGGGA